MTDPPGSTGKIDSARVVRTLVTALGDFDAACARLGLIYWIDGGTLLGAVRHQGPIPWDDDVDLVMPPADLERFLRDGAAELGPGYRVATPVDDDRIVAEGKVYIDGTHVEAETPESVHGILPKDDALFIDLFVAAAVSANPRVRTFQRRLSWLVASRPFAGRIAASSHPLSRARRLRWRLNSLVPRPVVRLIDACLTRATDRRDGSLLGVGRSSMQHDIGIPLAEIFPVQRMAFGEIKVSAPARPRDYLTREYGPDFMTPPPPDQRHVHAAAIWFDA